MAYTETRTIRHDHVFIQVNDLQLSLPLDALCAVVVLALALDELVLILVFDYGLCVE